MDTNKERFDKFIPIILEHEGGYVNDPKDSGGETKYGISKRAYPKLDIKNLTKDEAKEIYYQDYYKRMRCNEIESDLMALHLFDFGVNAGTSRAIKTAQRIVNVHVDGIIGRDTINAINADKDIAAKYINARETYYRWVGVGKNAKFLKGWLNRLKKTKL